MKKLFIYLLFFIPLISFPAKKITKFNKGTDFIVGVELKKDYKLNLNLGIDHRHRDGFMLTNARLNDKNVLENFFINMDYFVIPDRLNVNADFIYNPDADKFKNQYSDFPFLITTKYKQPITDNFYVMIGPIIGYKFKALGKSGDRKKNKYFVGKSLVVHYHMSDDWSNKVDARTYFNIFDDEVYWAPGFDTEIFKKFAEKDKEDERKINYNDPHVIKAIIKNKINPFSRFTDSNTKNLINALITTEQALDFYNETNDKFHTDKKQDDTFTILRERLIRDVKPLGDTLFTSRMVLNHMVMYDDETKKWAVGPVLDFSFGRVDFDGLQYVEDPKFKDANTEKEVKGKFKFIYNGILRSRDLQSGVRIAHTRVLKDTDKHVIRLELENNNYIEFETQNLYNVYHFKKETKDSEEFIESKKIYQKDVTNLAIDNKLSTFFDFEGENKSFFYHVRLGGDLSNRIEYKQSRENDKKMIKYGILKIRPIVTTKLGTLFRNGIRVEVTSDIDFEVPKRYLKGKKETSDKFFDTEDVKNRTNFSLAMSYRLL